ncbi:hypothetical protein [Streptomyces sp. SID2119]|uniref:hypothetical protein n=1 Tax=Streptomyces sp. SID2119 TaxID=2690253 RepID=UPI001371B34C|nr:hypothetical protein [Streptomyces sp. SID2119]MYW28338.1 hypothetical protein [Streptomyces sp. SID2119]
MGEQFRERVAALYADVDPLNLAMRVVNLEDELGADVDGICTGMHADVAEAQAEIERLAEIVRDYEHRINWFTTCAQCARLMDAVYDETIRADRYRLAWLSARRRAAEEANLGAEAVEHISRDRDLWRRYCDTARDTSAELSAEVAALRYQVEAVRAYALERCTEPYMNETSASWVLHLLGDD